MGLSDQRGMHNRPQTTIRIPQHLAADATFVQRGALQPNRVWRREEDKTVSLEQDAVQSSHSGLGVV